MASQNKAIPVTTSAGMFANATCLLWRVGMAVVAIGCVAMPLTVMSADAQQGTVHQFYGLGEISQFSKRVTSLRERRYQDIIQQRFDFSCGAAATATILRYAYDFDVNEVDVILGLAKVADEEVAREKGYSLLDIRHYVETLGLRGRGYELPAQMLAKLRIPTIALLDLRGYKHFVVIRQVTDDGVYVGDPALGNRVMPMDAFLQAWNGAVFAILGRGFDRNTVLTRPRPPLTARKFLYDHSPVTDSELLDFGFSHADLF
jgi:hypothetical protein